MFIFGLFVFYKNPGKGTLHAALIRFKLHLIIMFL